MNEFNRHKAKKRAKEERQRKEHEQERKITLEKQFFDGTQDLTKDEFIKRWTDHTRELSFIAHTAEEFDKIKEFREWFKELAGQEFERIYEKQNS